MESAKYHFLWIHNDIQNSCSANDNYGSIKYCPSDNFFDLSIGFTQSAFTCPKSAIETLEHGVFIVNFEHISNFVLVFLLLTLNM